MTSAQDLATEVIRSFRSAAPPVDHPPEPRPRSEPTPLGRPIRFDESERSGRADLLTTLRGRSSIRFFAGSSIPGPQLADIVGHGIATDTARWPDEQHTGALETNVVAFRVGGLEPGTYRLDGNRRTYVPVAPLPGPESLHDLTLQSEFCDSALIISLGVDLARVSERHGAHGYRMVMARAAAAAYTMWLDAVAEGLVGTVFAGFIPAAVRQSLHSDGTSRHQLFALTLGAAVERSTPEPPVAVSRR